MFFAVNTAMFGWCDMLERKLQCDLGQDRVTSLTITMQPRLEAHLMRRVKVGSNREAFAMSSTHHNVSLVLCSVFSAIVGLSFCAGSARAQVDRNAQISPVLTDSDDATTTTEAPTKQKPGTAVSDEAAAATSAEKLDRRAGEKVADDPKGRSVVLGMYLQEADDGRPKIVEVGAASPAFDAGVHEGDELLSFQGFSADSYRKWIDGIHRLTTDAPIGSLIPVVVLRDGERQTVRIRIPKSGLSTPKALAEKTVPGTQTGGDNTVIVPGQQPMQPIAATEPFVGEIFNDAPVTTAGVTERGVAQIARLSVPQARPATPGRIPSNTPLPAPGAAAAAAQANQLGIEPDQGRRIGLAGLRNEQNGMLVMVHVAGLAPGNYTVSITDPTLIGTGAATRIGTPGNVAPPAGTGPLPAPAVPPANPNRPFVPKSGSGQPATTPRTPVGQATPTGTNGAAAQSVPPTGRVSAEQTVPPTGQVTPSDATPTGQSQVNNALQDQANQATAERLAQHAGTADGVGTAGGTLNEIGTLTIDQNGTGRLQQVVEGVQVRDVVGQAIAIFAPANPATTPLPPAGQPVNDAAAAAAASTRTIPPVRAATGSMPVAAGIIRLVADRRPPETAVTPTGELR
jgi:hypothetical protein